MFLLCVPVMIVGAVCEHAVMWMRAGLDTQPWSARAQCHKVALLILTSWQHPNRKFTFLDEDGQMMFTGCT